MGTLGKDKGLSPTRLKVSWTREPGVAEGFQCPTEAPALKHFYLIHSFHLWQQTISLGYLYSFLQGFIRGSFIHSLCKTYCVLGIFMSLNKMNTTSPVQLIFFTKKFLTEV